jgi:hypothetical protein
MQGGARSATLMPHRTETPQHPNRNVQQDRRSAPLGQHFSGGGGWLEIEGVARDSAFVGEEPVFGVDASGEPSE